jgi:hypothetical protein
MNKSTDDGAQAPEARLGRPTQAGTVTLFLGRERCGKLEHQSVKEKTTVHALIIKALASYFKRENGTTF